MQKCLNCRFCAITKGNYKYPGVDEPLFSNKDFFAIASIGALIEGWTLVIPKEHHFSMKKQYRNPLLLNAINSVSSKICEKYEQNIIMFEHGANSNDSTTACGTSHAHLHLVPYPHSLKEELETKKMEWISCSPFEIEQISSGKEYLFYLDFKFETSWEVQTGYLNILQNPTSQFFRRILANQCGKAQLADYKTYPMFDEAAKTRAMLIS